MGLNQRMAADSVLRVWIVPDQTCRVPLDRMLRVTKQ